MSGFPPLIQARDAATATPSRSGRHSTRAERYSSPSPSMLRTTSSTGSTFALVLDGADDQPRAVDPTRHCSDAMRDFLARCESVPWFTSISSASSTTAWTTAALHSALGHRVEVWLPLSADTEQPAALTIGQRELHCAADELADRAGFPIELYGLARQALSTPAVQERLAALDPDLRELLLRSTRQVVAGAARELAVDRTDGPWLRAFEIVERGGCVCGFDAQSEPIELPK